MPVRRDAEARWEGGLKDGSGRMRLGGGAFDGSYSFGSRFEDQRGTNPEELIAAAHAGCFSMALAFGLEKAGHKPDSISTTARVQLEKSGDGFAITHIHLVTEGRVPGLDQAAFQKAADEAKAGCPVSKALAAVDIQLEAKLVS